MIQGLETTMKAGAVPQAPQFKAGVMGGSEAPFRPRQQPPTSNSSQNLYRGVDPVPSEVSKKETEKKAKSEEKAAAFGESKGEGSAVKPAGDPLGDARSKVQEEITNEFAAIMASGTLRASEAAALATRRVMQRYGHTSSAQS